MRRSLARFSRQEASNRIPSLVDFITITPGFRLSVHTTRLSCRFNFLAIRDQGAAAPCRTGTPLIGRAHGAPSGYATAWKLASHILMRALLPNSDLLSLHRTCDVVGLSNGKRDNRECRVAGGTSGELASVGDEYVLDVVGLPEFIDHAILRLCAHPVGAEIVSAWIGRRRIGDRRTDRLIDRGALLVGVCAHGDVVGVIIVVNGRPHAPGLKYAAMKGSRRDSVSIS